jgi:energy-coupling factor transport system substrate-specific component
MIKEAAYIQRHSIFIKSLPLNCQIILSKEKKMKDLFKVNTRTIVATGLGAAIFMLLFMYVKVPSPIPETSFQTAYGLSSFFAALFGPIAGALISFIGHALSDAVQYGTPWWSWVIASGVSGFVFGFAYKRTKVEEGEFKGKDILTFNVIQVIGNAISWILVAPVLDILIYQEPVNLVFTQGFTAFVMNSISAGIIGTLLLIAYAATRTKKGSLSKA